MKPEIALIGPGKVGCAVGRRLHLAGYPISAVIGRTQEQAADACRFIGCAPAAASNQLAAASKAKIILLTVKDDQISNLAKELHRLKKLSSDQTLIHFSGLKPASAMLSPSSETETISIHPLLPFADREIAIRALQNCPCAYEGSPARHHLAIELIAAFGGQAFPIEPEQKALYHASASIASNFLVTLLATSEELLKSCGIPTDQAIPLIMPLVRATLDNVEKVGTEQGLTGPIVRGDQSTITAHLTALQDASPQIDTLYRHLGIETVNLANKSGRLAVEYAKKLKEILASKRDRETTVF